MSLSTHLKNLTNFVSNITSPDLQAVLEDMLTPQEIVELSERIDLLKKLQSGQTQRKIAEDMKMSVTTVSRGSRVLQFGKQTIKKYL